MLATLLVCAAGNDGNRGPFEPASQRVGRWPSARWMLKVGARAYSNRGPWVDVYARGSDMVNAYPNGSYTYTEDEGPIGSTAYFTEHGLARLERTSFSTPLVAGLVAARMSWSREHATRRRGSSCPPTQAVRRAASECCDPGDADRGVKPPRGWRR